MEDVEHCHQINVKTFANVAQLSSKNMQLACIWGASWATQMEMNLMCIQAKHHDDRKFQSHGLTSWPKIFEMFSNNLPKMQDIKCINWLMHLELKW
jgi:hypothetical protein